MWTKNNPRSLASVLLTGKETVSTVGRARKNLFIVQIR